MKKLSHLPEKKLMLSDRQLQQPKTEGEKNYLQRKYERLDKEIDLPAGQAGLPALRLRLSGRRD